MGKGEERPNTPTRTQTSTSALGVLSDEIAVRIFSPRCLPPTLAPSPQSPREHRRTRARIQNGSGRRCDSYFPPQEVVNLVYEAIASPQGFGVFAHRNPVSLYRFSGGGKVRKDELANAKLDIQDPNLTTFRVPDKGPCGFFEGLYA